MGIFAKMKICGLRERKGAAASLPLAMARDLR